MCLQMSGEICTFIVVLCLIEQGIVHSTWKLHQPQPFLIDFFQAIWIFHLLQYLHLNLVSMSWKYYGNFGLVVSVMHQALLDAYNDKFHFSWPSLQRFYMWQRFFLFLHLHAVIPIFAMKCQAYPQKFRIVRRSTYFQRVSEKLFSCKSISMVNQDCFQIIPLFICEMIQLHCLNDILKLFFVNIVWLMQSNILYVSFMHIRVDTSLRSLIGVLCCTFVPGWVDGFSIIFSSKSSGFNLWISDLIFDNEKLLSSRLFVE